MHFSLVFFVAFSVVGLYETIRFRRALTITQSQRLEYVYALETTACKNRDVYSVKHNGNVVDCQAVRLMLKQNDLEQTFMLWWDTSWWVHLWKLITQNTAIFLTISCVIIIAGFYFASQTFLQYRMMSKMMSLYQPPQQLLLHQQQQLLEHEAPVLLEGPVKNSKTPYVPFQTKQRKSLYFL